MTYIKIGGKQYPAIIDYCGRDRNWNNRECNEITLEMTHAQAEKIFVDDIDWSVIYQEDSREIKKIIETKDENGDIIVNEVTEVITPDPVEHNYSDFCIAGPIIDNRDGTITVKMGKITDAEALAELMEVLA